MEAGGAGSPEFDEPLSIAGPPRSYPSESLLPYVQTVSEGREEGREAVELQVFKCRTLLQSVLDRSLSLPLSPLQADPDANVVHSWECACSGRAEHL